MTRPVSLILVALVALLTAGRVPSLVASSAPHLGFSMARRGAAPATLQQDNPTAAAALAQRILSGGGNDDAVAAVSEAFARAGIASIAADGTVSPAVEPTLPMTLPAFLARNLAADAAQRSQGSFRTTLADLATALSQGDWTLPAGQDPGTALLGVLRAAVTDAQASPQSPHSFVPLFLQAMAQAATPAADLSAQTTDPARVPLSLLETELLLTSQLRGNRSYPPDDQPASRHETGDRLRAALAGWLSLALQSAAAAGPCDAFEDNLGAFKSVHLVALDKLSGIPFDAFFERVGVVAVGKFAVTKFLTVLQILSTVGLPNLDVSVSPSEQHYSHGDEQHQATWTASVSVPNLSAGQDPAEQAVRDCLSTLGFALDSGQLQAAQKSWLVRWDIRGLGPPYAVRQHATVGTDKNQFYLPGGQNLAMQLGDAGRVQLVADMREESEEAHQNGIERHDTAWVAAKLDTSSMDATPFIKAAIGDAPEALLLVLGEWYKSAFGTEKQANLAVSWHEPANWELDFDSTLTHDAGPNHWLWHVHAAVPLRRSASGDFEGSAPSVLVDYSDSVGGCRVVVHDPTNDTFRVSKASVSPQAGPAGDLGVILLINPGNPLFLSDQCPVAGSDYNLRQDRFSLLFGNFHADERVADPSGLWYVITSWSAGSGDVYARKAYKRTQSVVGTDNETTTLELKRIPQQ